MPGKKKILPNFRLLARRVWARLPVIVPRGLSQLSALTFKYKPTTWFLNSHVRKVLFTIQTWDFPYIHTMFIFLSNISRRTPHCCKSVFLFIFCNMVMCDYQPENLRDIYDETQIASLRLPGNHNSGGNYDSDQFSPVSLQQQDVVRWRVEVCYQC